MMKVLFVCLGNICRSPTAHGVLEKQIKNHNLATQIQVDSCGTGSWHIGHAPDQRTLDAASKRGYDLSHIRARRLCAEDFQTFDYILAMDTRNLADVIKNAPLNYPGKIQLLLDYSQEKSVLEVPDPYYGGEQGFDQVFHLVEEACASLLNHLTDKIYAQV